MILPLHLLGLKALIEILIAFLSLNLKLDHELTYYMQYFQQGETKIPSEISFFIMFFFPETTCNEAACLLCLKIDTSFIAKYFFDYSIFGYNFHF